MEEEGGVSSLETVKKKANIVEQDYINDLNPARPESDANGRG